MTLDRLNQLIKTNYGQIYCANKLYNIFAFLMTNI